jgi:ATP-dependent DNA helicase RecG
VAGAEATDESLSRLAVLVRTDDGFAVAEEDLVRRGPGEALGTRQSGLEGLRLADPLADRDLLVTAREVAAGLASVPEGPAAFVEPLLLRRLRP